MDKNDISNHLYNDSVSQAVKYIDTIKDEESLFVYAYNYNWDNGFDIPSAIIASNSCTLSVALLLFHNADGISFLQDKRASDLPEWKRFISALYEMIISHKFKPGKAAFDPNLTKVQKYKLKKVLLASFTSYEVKAQNFTSTS